MSLSKVSVSTGTEEKENNLGCHIQKFSSAIYDIAMQLYQWQYVDTTGGSFSQRLDKNGTFALTPTHAWFWRWKPQGLVVINPDFSRNPHSTSPHPVHPSAIIHKAAYDYSKKVGAIIHVHAPFSNAFATQKKSIYPFTLQSQILWEVPCFDSDVDEVTQRHTRFIKSKEKPLNDVISWYDYALKHFEWFLTEMRLFLGKRSQELKRHGLVFTVYKHGIFVLARNIDEAFDNLLRVEKNAQTQIFASMLSWEPK